MSKSKVNWDEALRLRQEGATLKEIADRYGVTKQRVQDGMKRKFPDVRKRRRDAKIYENITPGMQKMFDDNPRMTVESVRRLIYGPRKSDEKMYHAQTEQIRRLVRGKNVKITIYAIGRLVQASGMTFEGLFGRADDGCSNKILVCKISSRFYCDCFCCLAFHSNFCMYRGSRINKRAEAEKEMR